MRKLIFMFCVLLIGFESPVFAASTHYTVGGHIACTNESAFKEGMGYAVTNDEKAFQKMMQAGLCIILKKGIEVNIIKVKMFKGVVVIRPVGDRINLWTPREAIKRK